MSAAVAMLDEPADAGQDDELGSARQLAAEIEALAGQARAASAQPIEPVSYSLELPHWLDPRPALADLAASIESLLAQLAPETMVRTGAGGAGAQTALSYTGRAITVISANLPDDLAWDHAASVRRRCALRGAFLGALASAGAAVLALSAAAANPLCIPSVISTACSLKDALTRLTAAARAAA